jgi:hypothetical protein
MPQHSDFRLLPTTERKRRTCPPPSSRRGRRNARVLDRLPNEIPARYPRVFGRGWIADVRHSAEGWKAAEAAPSISYGLFWPASDPAGGAHHRRVDCRRCGTVVTCGNPPATIPAFLRPRRAVHAALVYRLLAGSRHVRCHVGDVGALDHGRVHYRSHARDGRGRFDA